MKKIAVIGGGSWATAISKILLTNLDEINWMIKDASLIEFFKKHKTNRDFLSAVLFDTNKINFYNDINKVVEESDVLIFVVPSAFLKSTIEGLTVSLEDKYVVSAIKGIIPDDYLIVGDFFRQKYNVPTESIGIISGPSHAEEVAMERLSYLTCSSHDPRKSQILARLLECRYIKTTSSDDIHGTEYSAVLKNIMAIAAGICHSLGYGDNFQAVLISNAIQEIERFVDAVHPIDRDIKGSAYLGDLLVTAYSQFSRNRLFGNMIGKGYSVKTAQLEMNMIAEGYYAVEGIKKINEKYDVYMPITNAVYNIIYERIAPAIEIKILTDNLR